MPYRRALCPTVSAAGQPGSCRQSTPSRRYRNIYEQHAWASLLRGAEFKWMIERFDRSRKSRSDCRVGDSRPAILRQPIRLGGGAVEKGRSCSAVERACFAVGGSGRELPAVTFAGAKVSDVG